MYCTFTLYSKQLKKRRNKLLHHWQCSVESWRYFWESYTHTLSPALRVRYALVAAVGLTVIRRPSCGQTHIYYGSWRRWFCCSVWSSLISNVEKYVHILIRPRIWLWCQTTAVVNKVQPSHSQSVDNTQHSLYWQNLWYDARVEQEAGQLFITVAIFFCVSQWWSLKLFLLRPL